MCDGLWSLGRQRRGLNAHREPIATLFALHLPPCSDSRLPNPNSPAGDHAAVCSVLSNVVWPRAEVLEGQDDVAVSISWRTRNQLVCSGCVLENEYKCGKKRSGKQVESARLPPSALHIAFLTKATSPMRSAVVLALLFAASASALYSAGSKVIQLTDKDFNKVTKGDELWIVEFYAP